MSSKLMTPTWKLHILRQKPSLEREKGKEVGLNMFVYVCL